MEGEVISPVGWYAVTYAHVFTIVREECDSELTTCWVHENTILIKASSPTEAYDRCEQEFTHVCDGDYKEADDESIHYIGSFGGVLHIHVLFQEPGDLSEVYSLKEESTPEDISIRVRSRDEVIDSADAFGG